MFQKGLGLNCYSHPYLDKFTPLLCRFFFRNVTEPYGLCNDTCFISVMSQNFTDYATISLFLFPECTEPHELCNNAFFWFPAYHGTPQIVQWCFLLISGMSLNFTNCLTMGAKYLKVVKWKFHATKQWSPDEIRVWQLPLFTCLL